MVMLQGGRSLHNVVVLFSALLCALISTATASSAIRDPVKSLYTLQNVTIHTFAQRVTALSHFDLSFSLNTNDHVKLVLEPNHNIFAPDGLFMTVLGQDGQLVSQELVDRLSHKIYKGQAWTRGSEDDVWIPAGSARVSLHQDGSEPLFEGVFSVDHTSHYVQTTHNYRQTRHVRDPEAEHADREYMVMYRDSDSIDLGSDDAVRRSLSEESTGAVTCNADQLHFNAMPEHPVNQQILRRSESSWRGMSMGSLFGKRDIDPLAGGNPTGVDLVSTIGQTAGCPTTKKVALVGVATDCTYTNALSSKENVTRNVIQSMNDASHLYERTFGISLALANLSISELGCPATPAEATKWNQKCSESFNISDRLNTFSEWRGRQVDNNSHWTLLSTCATGSTVGLAWVGQACVNTAQVSNSTVTGTGDAAGAEIVSGANVVVRTEGVTESQVIAHETGHTFGAVHDCTTDTCPNGQFVAANRCCPLSSNTCDAGAKYIMNPSTSQGATDFSPCSIGNICSALGRNTVRSSCLSDNKNVVTYTGQQCGNGIVEPGEDCDCGGTFCGNNTCCDATTCKFKSGAVCDDSNDGCCHQCQFSSAGTVCRASTGVCDPQETCSGNSSACPVDATAPNGQSCGSGLQCTSGQCTSRDQQCINAMAGLKTADNLHACDSSGCQISCASSSFGTGVCYEVMQNFLEGTSCGGGGTCQNGQCKGSTLAGRIRAWIHDNRPLFIGLTVAVGLLVFFIFASCVWRCCRRCRGGRKVAPMGPPPGWSSGPWNSGPPPPPEYYGPGHRSRGMRRGTSSPSDTPSQPLMTGANGITQPAPGFLRRDQSVRYA